MRTQHWAEGSIRNNATSEVAGLHYTEKNLTAFALKQDSSEMSLGFWLFRTAAIILSI